MKKTTLTIFISLITTAILLTGCSKESTENISTRNNIKETNKTITNSVNKNNNDNNKEEKVNLELGTYIIQLDNTSEEIDDGGDEDISFLIDNKFKAYLGWGMSISGTYEIEDGNRIKCIADTFNSEYGPEQEIEAYIELEIKEDNIIEVKDASEKITIEIVEMGENGWELSGEYKEIYLALFTKGNTFGLTGEN